MHGVDLVRDLAIVLSVAGVVTVLFHRLRQPVVLGYIVAGIVVGPHTRPFEIIHDRHTIETLADLGVIFLMFSLGLEFRLRKLRDVGATAFVAASLEIVLMLGLGFGIGGWLGWSDIDSLFLGAMMSISSTTIIVKALSELGLARQRFAELIFGILIVEDILAIAMLALLSGIATTGALGVVEVAATLGRLGIFLAAVLVVGLLAVPPLLGLVARSRSNEMLLVSVLGLCFAVSLLAVELGYSVALGAFLIGAIVAESAQRHQIERLVEPVRDLFSAVFFIAIGLLIDPTALGQWWLPIVAITAAVVVGKVVTCALGTFVAGNPPRDALRVGMGLAQIGEFSFIIASLGTTLAVTSDFLYPIAVAVSVITTFLTPYLIRAADPLSQRLSAAAPGGLKLALGAYAGWAGGARDPASEPQPSPASRRLVRRLAAQIALNLALAAAAFGAAAGVVAGAPDVFPGLPQWIDTDHEMAQLVAVAVALPLVLTTLAKLRRMSLLLARSGVRRQASARQQARTESAVARVLFGAASFAVVLGVVAVSIPALPDLGSLALWLFLLGAASVLLWRPSLHVYGFARRRLRQVLSGGDEHAAKHRE